MKQFVFAALLLSVVAIANANAEDQYRERMAGVLPMPQLSRKLMAATTRDLLGAQKTTAIQATQKVTSSQATQKVNNWGYGGYNNYGGHHGGYNHGGYHHGGQNHGGWNNHHGGHRGGYGHYYGRK